MIGLFIEVCKRFTFLLKKLYKKHHSPSNYDMDEEKDPSSSQKMNP
jgi:hypothetical protein